MASNSNPNKIQPLPASSTNFRNILPAPPTVYASSFGNSGNLTSLLPLLPALSLTPGNEPTPLRPRALLPKVPIIMTGNPDSLPKSLNDVATLLSQSVDKNLGLLTTEQVLASYRDDVSDDDLTEDTPREAEPATSSASPSRRQRAPKSHLPPELKGLMGEANLRLARGEYDEVKLMCQEIIRSVPKCPEPYQTLSMLYEEIGEMDNAFQCGLFASHLEPRDVEEWIRLAEMALDIERKGEAIFCYRKALRYDRTNTTLMDEVFQLELEAGNKKGAVEIMERKLETESVKSEPLLYMTTCKEVAKIYNEMESNQKAIEVLNKMFEMFSNKVTSEEVNFLADFYLIEKRYDDIITLLTTYCGIIIDRSRQALDVPAELPVDLRSKLIVSLANLKEKKLVMIAVPPLYDENVEDAGDVFMEVAEALVEVQLYQSAESLLQHLVSSKTFSMPAVWLKFAECRYALGKLPEAADAFRKVLELVPEHLAARLQLASIQRKLGLGDQALETLQSDTAGGYNDLNESMVTDSSQASALYDPDYSEFSDKPARLLLETCKLLLEQKKFEELYKTCRYLLFGHLPKHFTLYSTLSEAVLSGPLQMTRMKLRSFLPPDQKKFPPAMEGDDSLSADECMQLFLLLVDTALENADFQVALLSCVCGMVVVPIADSKTQPEALDFKLIEVQIVSRDRNTSTFDLIRDKIAKQLDSTLGRTPNNQLFNLLSQINTLTYQDVRLARYSERLLMKYPSCFPLKLCHGHISIMFASYKSAINSYISIHDQKPDDPLLNMVIAVCFIHIICMKFTTQRATLAIQALYFFDKYMKVRGECQETYYNLGRAFQQIGVNSAAVFYYDKALATPPPIANDTNFDLTKEAAFNLSLLYRVSGSVKMAEYILHKYCVV